MKENVIKKIMVKIVQMLDLIKTMLNVMKYQHSKRKFTKYSKAFQYQIETI
jgi:hypothetical protein